MQRTFTLELRVSYEDEGKNEAMRLAFRAAARLVYAQARLLADGQQPMVSIFSDDFFHGHEDIKLLEDTVAQGMALLKAVGGDVPDVPEEALSDEMMELYRDNEAAKGEKAIVK